MEAFKQKRVVLVPYPFQGHITPMLQLGSILHSKGFSVIVLHTELNSPNPSNYPEFTFLHLQDNLDGCDISFYNMLNIIQVLNTNCEASFQEHMVRLLEEEEVYGEVSCIIYDSIMKFVDTVSYRLKIPTVILRTTTAAYMYAHFIMFRLMEEKVIPLSECRLEEVVPESDFLRYKDLPIPGNIAAPEEVLEFLHGYVDIRSAKAVIWNTVDMLDHMSLQQLRKHHWKVPFFSIGPLHKIAPKIIQTSIMHEDNSCLSWLDKQAPNSVLFVSLGSLAIIDNKELIAMAWGLAKSEQPFIWVVRPSLLNGSDASNYLPEDYFEMVGERGRVVKWAPQKKVLAHSSVGGFLTHCGWNSTLESLSEGVPMICRPCFSDQYINARYLTHVWKVGIELEKGFDGGIERAVRELMVSDEGKDMRKRAVDMKQALEGSIKNGGSSYESLNQMMEFINSLAGNQ